MQFCTCITYATLPHARVLADALARQHPEAVLYALDLRGGTPPLADEPFARVTLGDLEIEDLGRLGRAHVVEDLDVMLRPALLGHVRRQAADDVCFLTAEHDVLAPLPSPAVEGDQQVYFTPRVGAELPDDTQAPDEGSLRAHGPYSPDLLVVGRGPRADEFLAWYEARMAMLQPTLARSQPALERKQARRRARLIFALAPARLGLRPRTDPGLEASYWNLHARELSRKGAGWLAHGRPLRTIHFAGFDPQRPYWLSQQGTRVRVIDDPALQELCADYARRLLDRGGHRRDRGRDVGRRLPGGLVYDRRLRALHEEALAEGVALDDVFTSEGSAAFRDWMRSPAVVGASSGVNRYLYRIYLERPDLAGAFRDLDGDDGESLTNWAWRFGRCEMRIPDDLLPPTDGPRAAAARVGDPPSPAVNVAGFFNGTLGLGEAARLYVRALQAAGVAVTTTTVEVDRPVREAQRRLGKDYGNLEFADLRAAEECAFNLICVNADELPRFAEESGADFFAGRRSIGVWAWETDVIPARWDSAYQYLDEIWVYSRYVAEHLARASPIPVVCVPPPVVAPDGAGQSSGVVLPDGFRFMFMFDFFSTQRRKNAPGVIEAFRRAFAPGEGPQLLIKTIHGAARPESYDELRHAASGRPDVHIIDQALDVVAKSALMTECDCYVSLHRSEGYGLPLTECMALGKPVIATGYSGNVDFMTPANSYLVDSELTRVGDGVEIYPAEGRWAEPDLNHAAGLMREVYADREGARARGRRARRDIAATLAPDIVGAIARDRLERLIALQRAAQMPRR